MVTIPRVQKLAVSSNLPANDRIRTKAVDQSGTILKRSADVAKLGNTLIEVNKAYEDSKIDSLSSEANQKYAEWNVKKSQELKNFKGDPTDSFANYDIEEKAFLDKLIDDKPNLNERVKRGFTTNLGKYQDSNRLKMLKQRGYQKEVYEHNLFESDVKLNRNKLAIDVGSITEGDKSSSFEFNKGLHDLKTLVAKNAMRNGTAEEVKGDGRADHTYEDTDGNKIRINYKAPAKANLYTKMNKGVVASIDVLIDSGKHAEAKNMMKDYAVYIDSDSKGTFEKKLKSGQTERIARGNLMKLRGKTDDQTMLAIDKIGRHTEVGSEMIKIKHLNDSKVKRMKKDSEDKNFKLAWEEFEKVKDAGQMYTEKSILDNPTIKRVFEKLSKTQQAAMLQEYRSPKVSDVKAVTRMNDILLGDDKTYNIETMTSAQISEASVGLSEPHGNSLRNAVVKRQGIAGDAKSDRSTIIHKEASRLLTSLMYAKDLIENDKRGFLKPKSVVINNKSRLELINYLATQDLGRNPSEDKIFEHVRNFVNEKQKEKMFGSSDWFETKQQPIQKNNSDPLKDLDTNQKRALRRRYMDETGSTLPRDTDKAFIKWARGNN